MQIEQKPAAKQSGQNVTVSVPINFQVESHDNENKESQKVYIKEDKVMYVGGNKITMSFNIDIKVEPIDA